VPTVGLDRSGRWTDGLREKRLAATESIAGMLPDEGDPRVRRDVRGHHIDVDAGAFGDGLASLFEGISATRADYEQRALRGERLGDGTPESATRPTHQSNLAPQSEIHVGGA